MKLSKTAKARIKRMNASELKALLKASALLADCEVISAAKFATIARTCGVRIPY